MRLCSDDVVLIFGFIFLCFFMCMQLYARACHNSLGGIKENFNKKRETET